MKKLSPLRLQKLSFECRRYFGRVYCFDISIKLEGSEILTFRQNVDDPPTGDEESFWDFIFRRAKAELDLALLSKAEADK